MNNKNSILNRIIADKKLEVEHRRRRFPLTDVNPDSSARHRCLAASLKRNNAFHFICEVKKASPSKGVIRPDFDPLALARHYEANGAAAISVLTDEKYFQGSLDYLSRIRACTDLPLLRKDFIIDPYQIYESAAAGADLILLIARCLSTAQISAFYRLARRLGLDVLLEIGTEEDAGKIPPNDGHLIPGVNTRNLQTFKVDFERAGRIRKLLPNDLPVIGESGVRSGDDCRRLRDWGFAGTLIGETFMRAEQPGQLLKKFRQELNRA